MVCHKTIHNQGSREHGFSLVEVMVALAILGIVVVATTQAMVNSSSARKMDDCRVSPINVLVRASYVEP